VGCYEHFEFAHEAVGKLVKQGAVKEVDRRDIHCLLGLDVKVNTVGKKRLCLDARPVDKYEVRGPFKFESLAREGRDIFAGCTHGVTVDISHAYHHVDMHEDYHKYLGFKWARRPLYVFCVLPFGLQSGGAVGGLHSSGGVREGD
jgi:hypothetical protein